MSLLPGQILPQTVPIGTLSKDGKSVIIDKDWWLLIYNLCSQTLSTGQGFPADALQDLAGADTDAADSDAIVLRAQILSLQRQVLESDQVTTSDLPSIYKALAFAQDDLLQDPIPYAQQYVDITVGASPFTYQALSAGSVLLAGGTVSAVVLTRNVGFFTAPMTSGFFPVCRFDQITVTYSVLPEMTFLPWSSQ